MIVLARQQSKTQKVLEALVRRLPRTHPEHAYFQEQLRRVQAGFAGEQRVDDEWLEIDLPDPHYLLHDVQVTNRFGNTHQIDTILICSQFILLLEIKNIAGYLELDNSFSQFKRTTAKGSVEGMTNPFHQIMRHKEWMRWALQQAQIGLPIEHAVVFATKNAILSQSLHGQSIFHLSGLRFQIREMQKKYPQHVVTEDVLSNFVNRIIEMQTPIKRELTIPVKDVVKGVLCPNCSHIQKMKYHYKKWFCECCGKVDNTAIFEAIKDYRALIGEMITNRSFCEFFAISSPNVAYRILQDLPFQVTGMKKNRKYWIT